jgi:hypothetical protein
MPRRGLNLLLLTAVLAVAPSGCNIVGPAFVLVHGPPKVPKVHTLDPARPTVLFIDDPANRLPRRQLRVVIGQEAESQMLAKNVVKHDSKMNNMISAQSALGLADQERFGERRTIAQIGKDLGAEVVVWVAVDDFRLSPDGQTYAPSAKVRTRVVDAVNDAVIWPPEREGYPMLVTMPTKASAPPSSESEMRQAEVALAQYVGRAVAEQFYSEERRGSARAGEQR